MMFEKLIIVTVSTLPLNSGMLSCTLRVLSWHISVLYFLSWEGLAGWTFGYHVIGGVEACLWEKADEGCLTKVIFCKDSVF